MSYCTFLTRSLPGVVPISQTDPEKRLTAEEALLHPFFWPADTRLSFLIAVSDRFEREDRVHNSEFLAALEAVGPVALNNKNWDEALDPLLLADMGKYRKYNTKSMRDLLRVIRNKCNHFRELPLSLQVRH